MKEQTLKELWSSLDPEAQARLLGIISNNLFTTTTTAMAYVRGYRSVPERKRPKLSEIITKTHSVKLKFA